MAQTNLFDVWIVASQTVYKAVPYNVVTDWVTQGRLVADDRLKLSGTDQWVRLGDTAAFATFLPRPAAQAVKVGDVAEALEKVETDVQYGSHGLVFDADEDVDMIPLIDISLVLLVFFMMTATISAIAHSISLPQAVHAFDYEKKKGVIWVGVDQAAGSGTAVYSLGENESPPKPNEANMTEQQLYKAVEARLTEPGRAKIDVRIAGSKTVSIEAVYTVIDGLTKRKETGCGIDVIRAETTGNDK